MNDGDYTKPNSMCRAIRDRSSVPCGEHDPATGLYYCSNYCHSRNMLCRGAAVAFGLMGMAFAIRARCTCLPGAEWEDLCQGCKGYP